MAFERHCSRYGCPEIVYSDQGSNFVGVNHELRQQYELWNKSAQAWGSAWPQVEWRFAPPYSPRWNGHVEIMVKLFKKTLHNLMASHTQNLRTEEFYTLCATAAGMMNRRPLVQLGSEGDREVLTPAHFLLGGNPYLGLSPSLPEDADLRQRKTEVDRIAGELWVRLQEEYVRAQARYAKSKGRAGISLRPGDMVLVLNERTPVGLWAIGTILEAREGSDGLPRKFLLRVGKKVGLIRSAMMLAPIRIGSSLSNGRLLQEPPKLRLTDPWERDSHKLAEKRMRALAVLEARVKHEDAKRIYKLYTTGRDPGRFTPLRRDRGQTQSCRTPAGGRRRVFSV